MNKWINRCAWMFFVVCWWRRASFKVFYVGDPNELPEVANTDSTRNVRWFNTFFVFLSLMLFKSALTVTSWEMICNFTFLLLYKINTHTQRSMLLRNNSGISSFGFQNEPKRNHSFAIMGTAYETRFSDTYFSNTIIDTEFCMWLH